MCRSRHWAVKTPRTAYKTGTNNTALIPVLNTFKITTFPHLERRRNMTEYSLYNCIRYRCQAKYLTYHYLSDVLLGREKERLAITFWMCVV